MTATAPLKCMMPTTESSCAFGSADSRSPRWQCPAAGPVGAGHIDSPLAFIGAAESTRCFIALDNCDNCDNCDIHYNADSSDSADGSDDDSADDNLERVSQPAQPAGLDKSCETGRIQCPPMLANARQCSPMPSLHGLAG